MIEILGGGMALLLIGVLMAKYFPAVVAAFWRRLGTPSESALKKQSNARLAEMDRNIEERKARTGR